jgi:hypothetical protein
MATVPNFTYENQVVIDQSLKCFNTYTGADKVQAYLEKSGSESAAEYNRRLASSACGTTYRRAVNSIINIIFKNPITIDEGVSHDITRYYDTADGTKSLNELAKDLLRYMLLENKVYVLVWTPPVQASNAREEQQLGIRPYLSIISRDKVMDSVLRRDEYGNIEHIAVAGTYVYSQDKYEEETKTEYRVYFSDGTVEVFRETDGGIVLTDTIQSGVNELSIIELVFDDTVDIPPFINEANYQLQYYNIESAKDSYNKKLAFPFVTTWGMMANSAGIAMPSTDDNGNPINVVEFQSSKGVDFSVNPETGAKLGDVEIKELNGSADAVLKSTLQDKKDAIVDGFVRFISETTGNKTQTQSESERVVGESMVASLSYKMEEYVNQIHTLFSKFAGVAPQGYITTNKEFFDTSMDDLSYKMLSDLYSDGTIDKTAYLTELQNYGELKTVDISALNDRDIVNGR